MISSTTNNMIETFAGDFQNADSLNFFIIVPPKTAFPSHFRGKGELSQEKRTFSCSCDIKTIALFNIFVKTSPNFREIAAFAWHFFVNDAQLIFLEDTGSVENGKSEMLEKPREYKKPPRQTPGRLEKPSPVGRGTAA